MPPAVWSSRLGYNAVVASSVVWITMVNVSFFNETLSIMQLRLQWRSKYSRVVRLRDKCVLPLVGG